MKELLKKNKNILNIVLDSIYIISLIYLYLKEYAKLNLIIILIFFIIKVLLNINDISKKYLYYISFVILMIAITEYMIYNNHNFELNGYLVMIPIILIGVIDILRHIKFELSIITYIITFSVIGVTLSNIIMYKISTSVVRDTYGNSYTERLIKDTNVNDFHNIEEIRKELENDKIYKENIYNIIKCIRDNKKYIDNITSIDINDKLKNLEDVAIKFLEDVTKKEVDSSILYNKQYINEVIAAYDGGK